MSENADKLRPVQVYHYQPVPGNQTKRVAVPAYTAKFHGWFPFLRQQEHGDIVTTMGLVEDDAGNMSTHDHTMLRFLDRE